MTQSCINTELLPAEIILLLLLQPNASTVAISCRMRSLRCAKNSLFLVWSTCQWDTIYPRVVAKRWN